MSLQRLRNEVTNLRRRRLEKLETALALNADDPDREWTWQDWQRHREQHDAYLRGEGSRPADPPCPSGGDAEIWAKRMRQCFASDSLILNGYDESRVEFAPGTTEEEKREFWAFLEEVKWVSAEIAANGQLPP